MKSSVPVITSFGTAGGRRSETCMYRYSMNVGEVNDEKYVFAFKHRCLHLCLLYLVIYPLPGLKYTKICISVIQLLHMLPLLCRTSINVIVEDL